LVGLSSLSATGVDVATEDASCNGCIVDIADANSWSFLSVNVDRIDLIPEWERPITLPS
jgi:hypothetical protein